MDQIVQLKGIDFAGVKLREPCPHALEQRPQLLFVVRANDCASLPPPTALGCRTAAVAISTHVDTDASCARRLSAPASTETAMRIVSASTACCGSEIRVS